MTTDPVALFDRETFGAIVYVRRLVREGDIAAVSVRALAR